MTKRSRLTKKDRQMLAGLLVAILTGLWELVRLLFRGGRWSAVKYGELWKRGNGWGKAGLVAGPLLAVALLIPAGGGGSTSSDSVPEPSPAAATATLTTAPSSTRESASAPEPVYTVRSVVIPTITPKPEGASRARTLDLARADATALPAPGPTEPIDLQFVADVTVPDGTVMNPGESFTKAWRLRNAGQNDWPEGAVFDYYDGYHLETERKTELKAWAMGDVHDVAVNMIAPMTPGAYKSYWHVCDGDNCTESKVYVLIEVRDPNITPTPVPLPTVAVPVRAVPVVSSCCKRCNCPDTKPCGDGCIAASKTCHKGSGCACCK